MIEQRTLTLNLVSITTKSDNSTRYYGVNDKHYDGMLATGGSILDDQYSWRYLGDVMIEEQILNEEGFRDFGG